MNGHIPTMPLWTAGVVFITFLALGLTNLISYNRMLNEVNTQLDPQRQFGYLWYSPRKHFQVLRLHQQLYPNSRLRILNITPIAAWLLLIVLAALYFR